MRRRDAIPEFDGNEWEEFCRQGCARKYGVAWQKIPAKNHGDWGLEGFVRGAGIVVQCYADDSVSNRDRTRKQKGKLTSDIPKLHKYREELKAPLGMVVHTYLFLVPSFDDKDLLAHADEKAEMARGWGIPWIDPSFHIAIHDIDFLREEWNALRGDLRAVVDLTGAADIVGPAEDNELVATLQRKLAAIPRLARDPAKARTWRDSLLSDFVHGTGLFLKLDETSPQYADRIIKIVGGRERRLARRTYASEPIDDLNTLTAELADAIHRDIASIEDDDVGSISGAIVADWLMRCPLEYAP
jgi:hypothetical protein